jgi:hypothetical protein
LAELLGTPIPLAAPYNENGTSNLVTVSSKPGEVERGLMQPRITRSKPVATARCIATA